MAAFGRQLLGPCGVAGAAAQRDQAGARFPGPASKGG
jgi:hypothetical protein